MEGTETTTPMDTWQRDAKSRTFFFPSSFTFLELCTSSLGDEVTTYGVPGTAYPTGTIMEPIAVPGGGLGAPGTVYGAPPTAYGAPPGAMYAAPATAYGAAPTYAAPATTMGPPPDATYAAPTYAAPAEGTYAAPTYAAPAPTEGVYAAPTYAAPAGAPAGALYAAPAGTAPAETEGATTEMPTYAAPAEPVFAQGPVGTFTTDPQGMGTTMQPPQPKVLPTETVMGPVTQAGIMMLMVGGNLRNLRASN